MQLEKRITDIKHFYEMVSQIKKANRKYLSNFFLREPVFLKAIQQGDVTYVYKENEYLNLWWKKENFKRLYYFIADPCYYKIENDCSWCVCDFVGRPIHLAEVCETLRNAGMHRHAAYNRWVCDNPVHSNSKMHDDFRIVDEDDGNLFINALNLYFDKLSDLLPDQNETDEFIRDMHFIGIHDIYSDALVAGMVYSKEGCVITEKFLFAASGCRRQGMGRMLHNTLYKKYAGEKIKCIAWIRENNLESINLHKAYNYEKQNLMKITFLKTESI